MHTDVPAFEAIRRVRADGSTYWSARELASILGYESYRRFLPALTRARIVCKQQGYALEDHFTPSQEQASGVKRTKQRRTDVHLSRLACYLVLQNANPAYKQVALSQSYLAIQTRRYEEGRGQQEGPGDEMLPQGSNREFSHLLVRLGGADYAMQVFIETQVQAKLKREGITDSVQAQRIYAEVVQVVHELFPSSSQGTPPQAIILGEQSRELETEHHPVMSQEHGLMGGDKHDDTQA